jgi:hypothetical protein
MGGLSSLQENKPGSRKTEKDRKFVTEIFHLRIFMHYVHCEDTL